MKDYNSKEPHKEPSKQPYKEVLGRPVAAPAASPRPGTAATIDAMLDKMGELIRTRDAWANLAKLLLLRGEYPKSDPELVAAFHACFPATDSRPPTLDSL
jgi:hypothetical protein